MWQIVRIHIKVVLMGDKGEKKESNSYISRVACYMFNGCNSSTKISI